MIPIHDILNGYCFVYVVRNVVLCQKDVTSPNNLRFTDSILFIFYRCVYDAKVLQDTLLHTYNGLSTLVLR